MKGTCPTGGKENVPASMWFPTAFGAPGLVEAWGAASLDAHAVGEYTLQV